MQKINKTLCTLQYLFQYIKIHVLRVSDQERSSRDLVIAHKLYVDNLCERYGVTLN